MDINAAQTALRRAAKRHAHAARMLAEATSDRARARHARRIRNAERAAKGARYDFEALALEAAD